jgi:hypothetical protein
MTVIEPPETEPTKSVNTPDNEGEGKQDQNIKYDEFGNYLYTIGGDDDPSRDI